MKNKINKIQKTVLDNLIIDQNMDKNNLKVDTVKQINNTMFLIEYDNVKSSKDIIIINKKGEVSLPEYNTIYSH